MSLNVSVITTVKNEETNIVYLIDSILKQDYKFHEFVINDNNSADNTVALIEEFSLLDNRIKVVKSGNLSIGEGRNTAINHSSGDILALIDSGIAPSEEWLSNVVSPMITDETLDVVWGHVIFDTKSRVVESSSIALSLVFLTKYREERVNAVNVTSSAFRRRVWVELSGFPTIDLPIEDLLLIDKVRENNYKTVHAPEAKAYYFRFPETISEVYKKWSYAAYCSFVVKKSERGFGKQIVIFGSFFLSILLTIIDLRALALVGLYMLVYLTNKTFQNKSLAKRIFSKPEVCFTMLYLFFVLNIARAFGVIKAVINSVLGKVPKERTPE
jgi:glycosyltransferase involved in cell wall biosynthesis